MMMVIRGDCSAALGRRDRFGLFFGWAKQSSQDAGGYQDHYSDKSFSHVVPRLRILPEAGATSMVPRIHPIVLAWKGTS